jgi:hypothetical protein
MKRFLLLLPLLISASTALCAVPATDRDLEATNGMSLCHYECCYQSTTSKCPGPPASWSITDESGGTDTYFSDCPTGLSGPGCSGTPHECYTITWGPAWQQSCIHDTDDLPSTSLCETKRHGICFYYKLGICEPNDPGPSFGICNCNVVNYQYYDKAGTRRYCNTGSTTCPPGIP